MKKELPKIYQAKQNKNFTNNTSIFYGAYQDRQKSINIDDLFKINEIYRTSVKLVLKNKTVEKIIIGRTQNNLITLDNEIIPISEIIEIIEN